MSYRDNKRQRSDSHVRHRKNVEFPRDCCDDDRVYRDYKRSKQYKPRYEHNGKNYSSREKRNTYESRSRSPSPSKSSSMDDDIGHYMGKMGDKIELRYSITEELGKGTFGKVFKCFDSKYNETVALKVVRNIKKYIESAEIEAKYLSEIYDMQLKKGSNYCVKMFSHFYWNSYYVMVFERLGMSLYDVIKKNDYKRFPLPVVRSITKQLLLAMEFLKSVNIIHTDLKLENIMFVHTTMTTHQVEHHGKFYDVEVPQNTRIKVIDFGGATHDDDDDKSAIINTRQYRGPEVMLQYPQWSFPSDIWSIGCMVGEIYQGELLFQTHEELEHFALIEKLCGSIPTYMIERSVERKKYFDHHNRLRVDRLNRDSRHFVHNFPHSFEQIFDLSTNDKESGIIELMRDLLTVDPAKRITATEGLQYRFVQEEA